MSPQPSFAGGRLNAGGLLTSSLRCCTHMYIFICRVFVGCVLSVCSFLLTFLKRETVAAVAEERSAFSAGTETVKSDVVAVLGHIP